MGNCPHYNCFPPSPPHCMCCLPFHPYCIGHPAPFDPPGTFLPPRPRYGTAPPPPFDRSGIYCPPRHPSDTGSPSPIRRLCTWLRRDFRPDCTRRERHGRRLLPGQTAGEVRKTFYPRYHYPSILTWHPPALFSCDNVINIVISPKIKIV